MQSVPFCWKSYMRKVTPERHSKTPSVRCPWYVIDVFNL